MAIRENFIGMNQFVVFYGVVEDRQDPEQTGRVRVRCLGFHTKDKSLLPTADLPWAQVLLPITSSGISGIGQTPLGLVEGSWVVGYFRDGADAQEPIVLGSLPGKPTELPSDVANTNDGFYDPNGEYPRYKNEPDVNRLAVNAQKSTDEDGDEWVKEVVVSATGTGELINTFRRVRDGLKIPEMASTLSGAITQASKIKEQIAKVSGEIAGVEGKITNAVQSVKSALSGKTIDFKSLALKAVESNPAASLLLRRATQIKDISIAIPEAFSAAKSGLVGGDIASLITAAKSIGSIVASVTNIAGTFSQPDSGYGAVYPFNHVRETESGHIVEFDDTAGAERIHEMHRTGTGYEIHPDADRTVIVKKNQLHTITGFDKHNVGINYDQHVDGAINIGCNFGGLGGHYTVRVENGANIIIQTAGGNIGINARTGNITIKADGDINMECLNYNLKVLGTMTEDVKVARTSTTTGPWKLTGAPIDLN